MTPTGRRADYFDVTATIDRPAEPIDVEEMARTLHRRYPDVPLDVLRREVSDAARAFRDAKVLNYIPVLIERRVRHDLHLARVA